MKIQTRVAWLGFPVLWLGIFLVLPVLITLLVSFLKQSMGRFDTTFTLENYLELFTSITYLQIIWVTFKNAAMVTLLSLIFGYPVAYYLTFCVQRLEAKIILFIIALTPFWTSYLIRAVAWMPLLGRNGLINSALLQIGLISQPLDILLFSNFAVVLVMVQLYILFMISPIFFSLSNIKQSLIEAARDLGATPFQIFRWVIWPLSVPGVAIGTVFVFVLSMGEFATVRLIGGGNASSLGLTIQNFVSYIQFPSASAVASVLVTILVVSVWFLFKLGQVREEL